MSRRPTVALIAALAAGCGGGAQAESPSNVIAAYAGALSRGDADAAWRLLDEDARRGRTGAEHGALMHANAEELREQGHALARVASSSDAVAARARLELDSGETVVLVLDEDGWRIDGGVLDAAGLGTPIDAVAAFRRALMRRDLPGVERTLSRQTRAEWEEEVRRLLEATADREDLEIEVDGDRARVHTTGGGSIELIRESGEWRVVDVHGP